MKEIPMGVTVDSDRLKGLVDAANEQDLREKMCDLKERWEWSERHRHSIPQVNQFNLFYEWFVTEKADAVVKCMLPEVYKKLV